MDLSPSKSSLRSNWIAFAALATGLAGIALGGVAIATRADDVSTVTNSAAPPTYTAEQAIAAKNKICEKYAEVKQGVEENTRSVAEPGPNKEVLDYVASAQARLSLVAGSASLLKHLDPATPKDLADATEILAAVFLDQATAALTGMSNTDPAWQKLETREFVAKKEVERLCE